MINESDLRHNSDKCLRKVIFIRIYFIGAGWCTFGSKPPALPLI